MTFGDVVEAVKSLSTEEKEAIQQLLQQYLREERRDELYDSFLISKAEEESGNLRFSSNLEELKEQLFEN